MYVYQAELYCDSCGESLEEHLTVGDNGDSDTFPQYAPEGEADGPTHCASRDRCLERVSLRDYGLGSDDVLYGAESVWVGAPMQGLTDDGRVYMDAMIEEPDPTPYQAALHRLWEAVYA